MKTILALLKLSTTLFCVLFLSGLPNLLASDFSTARVNTSGLAVTDTEVTVGQLHSETGMLYYPTFYEGLEQSKNVIYTGQEATQQILAGLDWIAKEKKAKTFYLI